MARGDRFFFHPTRTVYDRPEEHGLEYEQVVFTGQQGHRLNGWFFPADGPAAGTVVHCHGNAGNITGHYRFVAWLPRRGWNVLCFDYRGYWRSEGRPTREAAVADTHAAVDWVMHRDGVDPARIVLFGQSLGGTMAVVAAAQRDDLAGLAVEGSYASHREEVRFICGRTWWLWGVSRVVPRVFIAGGCDPIDVVDRVGPIPKLFICGTCDRIVDYRQTVALHERAGGPKELWVIEGGGHTDALVDDEPDADNPAISKRDRFCRFLERSVNARGGSCR